MRLIHGTLLGSQRLLMTSICSTFSAYLFGGTTIGESMGSSIVSTFIPSVLSTKPQASWSARISFVHNVCLKKLKAPYASPIYKSPKQTCDVGRRFREIPTEPGVRRQGFPRKQSSAKALLTLPRNDVSKVPTGSLVPA